jgi:hypothetical protein
MANGANINDPNTNIAKRRNINLSSLARGIRVNQHF